MALSDNEKIRAVVSGVNAARQFHPYFDSQLEAWLSGEVLYWWFDKGKIEEHTDITLLCLMFSILIHELQSSKDSQDQLGIHSASN